MTKRERKPTQCLVINSREVADMLDISLVTLQRWVNSGKIPGPRFKGQAWRWIRKDFEAWINNEPQAIAAHEQELQRRAERENQAARLRAIVEGEGGQNPTDD